MARVSKKPLADADEEAIVQGIVAIADDYGANWQLEEFLNIHGNPTDAELDDHVDEDDHDDEAFDLRMIIQRLRPYSLGERKRILKRAHTLCEDHF